MRALNPKSWIYLLYVPEACLQRRWPRTNGVGKSKHELGICPSILTGMIEWMGAESPDTPSLRALGFLLVLALAKSAPTLAGSRPVVTDA